jgi:hypothetical protein
MSETRERVTEVMCELRDLRMEQRSLEERLNALRKRAEVIEREQLPALFNQERVDSLGLPASGNLPAMDFKLEPYFKANIAASWEPERREAAFKYLERRGAGDLIKSEIVITLPRGSEGLRRQIIAGLRKLKVEFVADLSVPWTTLSAWVRESFRDGENVDLEVIGGDVGEVVKIRERRT